MRFKSIRTIRYKSALTKLNRFTGSRFAVCSNRECEIVAIRVDSYCSSRIVSCKVESSHWKSTRFGNIMGGNHRESSLFYSLANCDLTCMISICIYYSLYDNPLRQRSYAFISFSSVIQFVGTILFLSFVLLRRL